MSLLDNDTTIVAGLADAGQRMTSLSSNIGLLQALLGDVSNTVNMDELTNCIMMLRRRRTRSRMRRWLWTTTMMSE